MTAALPTPARAAARTAPRTAPRAAAGRLAAALLALALAAPLAGPAQARGPADEGIDLGRKSRMIGLASAEDIERSAARQYADLLRQAAAQRALAPRDHPQVQRLQRIADRLIAESARYNERAARWTWEVNLIGSKQINAFCMPGGKIAFFTGILTTLQLTDDEVAIVMGHEIAHALREHGRERVGKQRLAQVGTVIAAIGGALLGFGDLGGQVASGAAQLTMLKYGRDDETEADLLGLELAARAGFDPRAGLVVWQKMAAASKGQPPQWLSSHPSHAARIDEIGRALAKVMPIYARTRGLALDALPPYVSNTGAPIPWPLRLARR